MPSAISGAWSPSPDGIASRASWVKAPSVGVVAAAWISTAPSAVRSSCTGALVSAVGGGDHVRRPAILGARL